MASLPGATTEVVETTIATADGTDTVCVLAPVPLHADMVPRLYGNADAILAYHGFSEGCEYSAFNAERLAKPIYFVGVPIAVPGVISREDTSGRVTGTAVTTIAAGSSGVLSEHDGALRVKSGGVRGTDQIMLELSMDRGKTWRSVRLGTDTSYTIPYHGVVISVGAGTLVAGEQIHTWHGSAPVADGTALATARAKLAERDTEFRTMLLVGDCRTHTDAAAFLAQLNAYKTSDGRAVLGRCSAKDRLPQAVMSQTRAAMTGDPSLTFAEVGGTGDTITRGAGSWIADGFVVGDTIRVTGSASNNVTGLATNVTASTITFGTTDLVAEGPVQGVTVTAEPTLTFAEVGGTGDTLVRNRGSWLDDGFRAGDLVAITGTVSNNITGAAGIATVTATTITFGTDDLAAEVIGAYGVSITAGQTKAEWMAALAADYETVTAAPRIDVSAGRQWEISPLTQWYKRIPISWVASLREYAHDLHITTWRKSDGPTGGELKDPDGLATEWDDRIDGGAGCGSRFTVARTWNKPKGAYIAMSLTRAVDSSVLSLTNNAHVVNLAENVCQEATENSVGRSLVLNKDGTATADSLSTISAEVNAALEMALLQDAKQEGPRASLALWTPAKGDVLNVVDAVLHGTLKLNLNGTLHSIDTKVQVMSGGQS